MGEPMIAACIVSVFAHAVGPSPQQALKICVTHKTRTKGRRQHHSIKPMPLNSTQQPSGTAKVLIMLVCLPQLRRGVVEAKF